MAMDGYSSWIASRCGTTSNKASKTTRKYNKAEKTGNSYVDQTAERLRRMLEADQKNKRIIEEMLKYIDNLGNTEIMNTQKVIQDLTNIRENSKIGNQGVHYAVKEDGSKVIYDYDMGVITTIDKNGNATPRKMGDGYETVGDIHNYDHIERAQEITYKNGEKASQEYLAKHGLSKDTAEDTPNKTESSQKTDTTSSPNAGKTNQGVHFAVREDGSKWIYDYEMGVITIIDKSGKVLPPREMGGGYVTVGSLEDYDYIDRAQEITYKNGEKASQEYLAKFGLAKEKETTEKSDENSDENSNAKLEALISLIKNLNVMPENGISREEQKQKLKEMRDRFGLTAEQFEAALNHVKNKVGRELGGTEQTTIPVEIPKDGYSSWMESAADKSIEEHFKTEEPTKVEIPKDGYSSWMENTADKSIEEHFKTEEPAKVEIPKDGYSSWMENTADKSIEEHFKTEEPTKVEIPKDGYSSWMENTADKSIEEHFKTEEPTKVEIPKDGYSSWMENTADKSIEEHFKTEEPAKVEIPKDGYSSWIADRQIINDLTKLTEEERKAKLDSGEISQRQYNSAAYEIEKAKKIQESLDQLKETETVGIDTAVLDEFLSVLDEWIKMTPEKYVDNMNSAIAAFKENGDFVSLIQDFGFRWAFRKALASEDNTGNLYEQLARELGISTDEAEKIIHDNVEKAGKMYGEDWREGVTAATAILFSYIVELGTHFTYHTGWDPATAVDCRGAAWALNLAANDFDYAKTIERGSYGCLPDVYSLGNPNYKNDKTGAAKDYFVEQIALKDVKAGDFLVSLNSPAHVELIIARGIDDYTGKETIYTWNFADGYIQSHVEQELNKNYYASDGQKYYHAQSVLNKWHDENPNYSVQDVSAVVQKYYNQGSEAYWEMIDAMEAELNGGAKVALEGNTYTTENTKETTSTKSTQPEVEIPKDGYSSWIADRQIINDLTKLTEEELDTKLARGEISQRQYDSVAYEIEKANKIQESLDQLKEANTATKGDSVYPTIGSDGKPLSIEECEELYVNSFVADSYKYAKKVVFYVKETGEIIEDWGTLRIPKGETYTVYALHPYINGKPTRTEGSIIYTKFGTAGNTKAGDYADIVGNISHEKDGTKKEYVDGINYVEYKITGTELTAGKGDVEVNKEGTFNKDKNGVRMSITLYYDTDKFNGQKAMSNFFVEVYEP